MCNAIVKDDYEFLEKEKNVKKLLLVFNENTHMFSVANSFCTFGVEY